MALVCSPLKKRESRMIRGPLHRNGKPLQLKIPQKEYYELLNLIKNGIFAEVQDCNDIILDNYIKKPYGLIIEVIYLHVVESIGEENEFYIPDQLSLPDPEAVHLSEKVIQPAIKQVLGEEYHLEISPL